MFNNTTHHRRLPFFIIPECVTTFRQDTVGGIHSNILTTFYAINMVAVIVFNTLLVIGLCNTRKKNKFTNSNKLFLFLCASDLLAGIVLMPLQITYIQLVPNITCLQTGVRAFWSAFPIVLSGTNILVITLDRYLMMVMNKQYRQWFSGNCLLIAIICTEIAISFGWAIWYVFSTQTIEKEVPASFFISLSVYQFIVLTVVVILNIMMVQKVHISRKNTTLSNNNRVEQVLSRTITMISAALVVCYTPGVIATGSTGFYLLNSTNREHLRKMTIVLLYCLIPTQVNSALNAFIYLFRNTRIRRYYKRVLCEVGDHHIDTGDTNDSLASHRGMFRHSTKKHHHTYVLEQRYHNGSISSLNRNTETPPQQESEM